MNNTRSEEEWASGACIAFGAFNYLTNFPWWLAGRINKCKKKQTNINRGSRVANTNSKATTSPFLFKNKLFHSTFEGLNPIDSMKREIPNFILHNS